jgi:ribonuclease HI
MSNIYTKEQLEKRGWTDEKIEVLLYKPYTEGDKTGWNRKQIRKIEKYDEYINFTGAKDYLHRREMILERQQDMTLHAIAEFKNLEPTIDNHNCLIKNTDSYKDENGNFPMEIVHYTKDKDFDKHGTFKMFTDGCLKVVGNETFVTCGGWIKNSKEEIVVEFARELNAKEMNSAYDFEIFGIMTGIALAKELELKNIKCFTDSSGEAKILSLAIGGFTQDRMLDLPEVYLPVIENFKSLNAEIFFIPREYNQHADDLTKVHMNIHKENEKKVLNEQKQQIMAEGFSYTMGEKPVYFIHPKLEVTPDFESLKDNTKWSLYTTYDPNNKKYSNFLIDNKTQEFHLLSKVRKFDVVEHHYEGLTSEDRQNKNSTPDSANLFNLIECLQQLRDLKELSVMNISSGFRATLENIVPIREKTKEEYFAFHKEINNFDKIYTSDISPEIGRKIKKYLSSVAQEEKEQKKQLKI